ncbi:hypothetical protein SKAU_G00419110 [Synaphobranchus kaupii]|uniref:Uncharacterized protein n=1 Tax=Synaphobranchus kaupii TaxID=118154 RepID=A0A9Q1IA68_SYNKA|nr:hypothetical protein SKAU_G00419110 [Synaphobranchus kaupii]
MWPVLFSACLYQDTEIIASVKAARDHLGALFVLYQGAWEGPDNRCGEKRHRTAPKRRQRAKRGRDKYALEFRRFVTSSQRGGANDCGTVVTLSNHNG